MSLDSKIEQSKILLVGAGGIGCEVLKNLTLTGFKNIDAIDLDTIDVSNLNRQFLFNKSHVGKSKAEVAIQVAKQEYTPNPDDVHFNAIHKSIMLAEFDVDFFRKYTFVINALDNRAARSHVNRMCLSAQVPLLESGTAGYTGQATMIKNNLTACYECEGIQKEGKTYATCTIRNTPSQPIHCIVWAKHLFHQLFGEDDPDNDVSPQIEANAENPEQLKNGHSNSEPHQAPTIKKPTSTREWATQTDYDPVLIIQKLYNTDINYLLSMENLWKNRTKPKPLDYVDLISDTNSEQAHCSKQIDQQDDYKLDKQRLWSPKECVNIFSDCVRELYVRTKSNGYQHWDKDDEVALDFVVAASNLRSKCFNIETKSSFDVKSLAGNIVPAISSTNSIIGGILVLQALRILKAIPVGDEYTQMEDEKRNELLKGVGRTTYLNYTSLASRPDLIASYECAPPLETCLACTRGKTPEIELYLPMSEVTFADFVDKIIIGTFHFVCPDIALNDSSGTIIWSKDEDDGELDKSKKLTDMPHIKKPKTRVLLSDLLQDKQLLLCIVDDKWEDDKYSNFFHAKMNGKEIAV